MGKDGAWIARGAELHRIAPVPVARVVDTTGRPIQAVVEEVLGWL